MLKEMTSHSQMSELNTILQEIKANAAAAERNLWELQHQLQAKLREEEDLRARLARKRGQVHQDPSHSRGPDAPVSVQDELMLQKLDALAQKIERIEEEICSDQKAKLQLLKSVEYRLQGAHRPTMMDAMMLDSGDRPVALLSLMHIMQNLPNTNAEILRRVRFFEFANAMQRAAVQDFKRDGVINMEMAAVTGLRYAGVKLDVIPASPMSSADLALL